MMSAINLLNIDRRDRKRSSTDILTHVYLMIHNNVYNVRWCLHNSFISKMPAGTLQKAPIILKFEQLNQVALPNFSCNMNHKYTVNFL